MLPLPAPQVGGTLAVLRDVVNVARDEDFALLLAFLVSAMRPTGPFPILLLQGEQGSANFERAMREYRRALEIDPKLAQAYVYRGVLHLQMGNIEAARADLATLRGLDAALAEKLEKVIAQQARDDRDGLAAQIEGAY